MKKLTEQANGVFVIAVTPFGADGSLDLESADRMVDFYLDKGVTGLTVLGMMGEAPKLTSEESSAVVQRILKRVDGRVPVVAGVSAPGFAQMKTLSDQVMNDGAAGVMIAPPASLKTDEQIVTYYHQASEAIGRDVPFVLQDFPLATGIHMSLPVIRRIVKDLPACVCLKHEDWPGLDKISALRKEGALARRISILCGNGGLFLPEEMRRGADGAMTGFGYPEMMVDVVREMNADRVARARDLFDAYLPLARYEQQPGKGLSVRKYVLWKRGVIAEAVLRQPGGVLDAKTCEEIDLLISRQEKRLEEIG